MFVPLCGSLGIIVLYAVSEDIHSLVFFAKRRRNLFSISRFYKSRSTSGSLPNFQIYLNRKYEILIPWWFCESKLLARSLVAVFAIHVPF